MRSKSTNLAQVSMHGNEKPIPKTINLNQMHFNSSQRLNFTEQVVGSTNKKYSSFYNSPHQAVNSAPI